MIKLFFKKPMAPSLLLLAAICYLCPTEAYASAAQQPNSQSAISPAAKESIVVARIAYYMITRGELEKRLMTELHPYDYDNYDENAEPIDAKTMLMKMVAEKAMIIEARAQGYLENEAISSSVKRFSERKLVNLLLQRHVEGKITVTEDEITRGMKADPKLDKARAKATIERAKTNMMLDQYYKQIYDKSRASKLRQNFPRVIQIHERLLRNPKQSRKVGFIRTSQVKEELTQQEKNIVLAQYNSGKITLKDWFDALCDIVPPRRPRDLNTPKGVDQLLERAMRMPLLVSEAKALKLDRDKDLLKQVRDYEDRRLLSEAMSAKRKELKEPTTDQILAYFARNKESFGTSKSLKIDLIWCKDLQTAKQARAALSSGEDFEAVRQQYSLEKQGKPFTTHPSSEGLFWKDLWVGNPNQVIGPVKGFYQQGISWRIVKVLEKTPGQEKQYSSNMDGQIKSRMMSKLNKALIAQYGKELLKKYPYQIYPDSIKDINPLDIP
ncbi:peptidylprolyl isomerase [Planctomycetota bacterium]